MERSLPKQNYLLWLVVIALFGTIIAWQISYDLQFSLIILCAISIWFLKPEMVIGLVVLFMINFWGLIEFSRTFASIKLPIGTINFGDLIFGLTLLYTFIKLPWRRDLKISQTQLNVPLYLFFVYLGFQIIRALFFIGEDFQIVFRIARPMGYYLLFFSLTSSIQSKKALDKALKYICIIVLISIIIVLYQVYTGTSFHVGTGNVRFVEDYGLYRPRSESLMLIDAWIIVAFYLFYTHRKAFMKIFYLINFLVAAIPLMFSLTRSVWISSISVIIVGMVALSKTTNLVKTVSIAAIVSLLILSFSIQKISTFLPLEAFTQRFVSAREEVTYKSGSYGGRTRIFSVQWEMTKAKSLLLGAGLSYYGQKRLGSESRFSWFSYASHGADNGLSYLIMRLGLIGVAIFIWIFYRYYKIALRAYLNIRNPFYKSLILGGMAINFVMLATLFFSNRLFQPSTLIVLLISWAFTVKIDELLGHPQEHRDA